jgi:hypothetical protein
VSAPLFCKEPHPTVGDASCARLHGHEGSHAAFTFLITQADEWGEGASDDEASDPVALDDDPPF